MVMKNVKNADFVQINKTIKRIAEKTGTEILPAITAWKKYSWVRKYYISRPKEGYFIWAKKSGVVPITTCVTVTGKNQQYMNNVIVIDKNVRAKAYANCFSLNSRGTIHESKGRVILKKGAELIIEHNHSWNILDVLKMDYSFILEENSKLIYRYFSRKNAGKTDISTTANLEKGASALFDLRAKVERGEYNLSDKILLKGEESSGTIKIRILGMKDSKIRGETSVEAYKKAKGHLDCQGLMIGNTSNIELIPALFNKCNKAILTHEASIGSINDEEINYLMSRGLGKKDAIDLIVNGFFNR